MVHRELRGRMRRPVRLAVIWCVLLAAFSATLVLAFSVPDSAVRAHVGTSLAHLEKEGHPYRPLLGMASVMPDNYTDAIKLNMALNPIGATPIQAAFGSQLLVVFEEGASGIDAEIRPIESLRIAYEDRASEGEAYSYARYWHGYQAVLRPALALFDLRAIRFLNVLVMAGLIGFVAVVVRHRLGLAAMIALLASLVIGGVFAVPLSVQYVGVFVLALAGAALVGRGIDREGHLEHDLEVFLVLGSLTAFVDLLTTPLLSLTLPLAVLLMARMSSETASRAAQQFGVMLRTSLAWGFGYVATWVSKWVLSTIILGEDVLSLASELALRQFDGTDISGESVERLDAVMWNIAMLVPIFGFNQEIGVQWGVVIRTTAILAVALILPALALVWHRRKDGFMTRLLPLLPLAVAPYLWYLLMYEHSRIHHWFTYRLQIPSVFIIVFVLLYSLDPGYLYRVKRRAEAILKPREA